MAKERESNPYASPVAAKPEKAFGELAREVAVDFVPIMRRWWRLRLYYNAVLLAFVLFLALFFYSHKAADILFWIAVCFGGVVANLCFFAGPTVEAYGRCFRLWNDAMTTLLYLAGLGLTALLALFSIASF